MLTELQKQLLNHYQRDFPLSLTPYLDIANKLGYHENDIINALKELDEKDIVSRVGAVVAPNRIGVSTLAAIAAPPDKITAIADIISQYMEVNHNYEREHPYYTLWFVVTAGSLEQLQRVLDQIELQTGYRLMSLPLVEAFFIDLGFELDFDDN
jgi:DNA-binding Lrp family transcriptional regulator